MARDLCRRLPVDHLARAAGRPLVQERRRIFVVGQRAALAQNRPAPYRLRHVEALEILVVRLQHVRPESVEHGLPLLVGRMAHHGDAQGPIRRSARRDGRLGRRHPALRLGKHEAHRIGAGVDGHRNVVGAGQSADLDQELHAASALVPASRIAATSAAGLEARISAVPTSAIR